MGNFHEINAPRHEQHYLAYVCFTALMEIILRPQGFGYAYPTVDGATDVCIIPPTPGNPALSPATDVNGRTQSHSHNSYIGQSREVELKLLCSEAQEDMWRTTATFLLAPFSNAFEFALLCFKPMNQPGAAHPMFAASGMINRQHCYPDIVAINCVMSRHCFLLPMVRAFVVVALSFGVSNIVFFYLSVRRAIQRYGTANTG
jgi:hypothetical protein